MLGQNITRLMKENGYTQRQLAMRAGCSECAISRYVNYEREPSIRILKNLAIALGVTVDELISERYCKDCIRYEDCKEYVSPYETFPETDGCERFQSAADVVPKSEVAREIMQEVRQVLLNMVLANSMGETYDIEKHFAEIEKKYTEDPAEDRQSSNKSL